MKIMDKLPVRISQFLVVILLALPYPALCATDWFEQGLSHMRAHQYQKAIVAFAKAIAQDPNRVETYNNRGIAWCNNGDYDLALADFNRAMEIDPRNAEIFNNRGTIWFYKGKYDRAISDYDQALGIDPAFAKAYTNRGAAWFCKGNFNLALSDYQKALEIEPDNVEINRQLAWILANTSQKTPKHERQSRPPTKPAVPQPKSAMPIQQSATPHPEITVQSQTSGSKQGYSIQVGAFSLKKNAEKLAASLRRKGYETRVTPFFTWSKNVLHTVRIGKYAHFETAKKKAAELTEKENIPATVRPANEL